MKLRNTVFVVALVAVGILVGGMWQIKNLNKSKVSVADFEKHKDMITAGLINVYKAGIPLSDPLRMAKIKDFIRHSGLSMSPERCAGLYGHIWEETEWGDISVFYNSSVLSYSFRDWTHDYASGFRRCVLCDTEQAKVKVPVPAETKLEWVPESECAGWKGE